MCMLKRDLTTPDSLQEVKIGEKLQGKCLRNVSPESPVKLYCCYIVIMVLTVTVIGLSIALSVRKEIVAISRPGPYYSTCPKDWIGFGSKCFYFSEDVRNWTFSQTYCMALEARLALYDSLEELNFLKRYKGASDYWIGLHRESPEHPWTWTDNTEYNNLYVF
uniref:C-type lectin domain family 2 member E-like n=1 Tax=Myodes glareolus TaxID=447135 RepID=UPI002020414B|nr:C-type lectin domain family 2 member E-like [Myodes glareolus]